MKLTKKEFTDLTLGLDELILKMENYITDEHDWESNDYFMNRKYELVKLKNKIFSMAVKGDCE